jgi:hypothetical protein
MALPHHDGGVHSVVKGGKGPVDVGVYDVVKSAMMAAEEMRPSLTVPTRLYINICTPPKDAVLAQPCCAASLLHAP